MNAIKIVNAQHVIGETAYGHVEVERYATGVTVNCWLIEYPTGEHVLRAPAGVAITAESRVCILTLAEDALASIPFPEIPAARAAE